MGDGVRTELPRHVRNRLRLHGTLGTDTQRIQLAALHIPHDEEAQHLLEVVRARVDLMMLDGAQRASPLAESACRVSIYTPGVDGNGNDGATVVLRNPRNEKRRVEPPE